MRKLDEEGLEARALDDKDPIRVQAAAAADYVGNGARWQHRGAPRRVAAEQGAVQVEYHCQPPGMLRLLRRGGGNIRIDSLSR